MPSQETTAGLAEWTGPPLAFETRQAFRKFGLLVQPACCWLCFRWNWRFVQPGEYLDDAMTLALVKATTVIARHTVDVGIHREGMSAIQVPDHVAVGGRHGGHDEFRAALEQSTRGSEGGAQSIEVS